MFHTLHFSCIAYTLKHLPKFTKHITLVSSDWPCSICVVFVFEENSFRVQTTYETFLNGMTDN